MAKRIKWLDFARGITMFFVVIGHSLSTIYNTKNINPMFFITLSSIIFTFVMPSFFAISGYLYKPVNNFKNYMIMILNKIIKLGIPYVLFSIIYVFMQSFGGNSVNNPLNYKNLLQIYSTPIAYLWFLYALFLIFVIVGFLDVIHLNKYSQLFIYLLFTIISFIFSKHIWIGLQYTFNNILFFYIGYLISNSKICSNFSKTNKIIKNKRMIYLSIIIFIFLLIIQSFYITGTATDNTTFADFFTKIISVILLIQISQILPNNKFYNHFTNYGKLTLIIYLIHAPIMSIARVISFRMININNITSILLSIFLTIIIWYMSILVCYVSKKLHFIHCIFYPPFKIKN